MENLEDKLVLEKVLTKEQYGRAKEEAYKCQKSFWSMLVKLGFLSADDLSVIFAQESGIAYARIADYKLNPEVMKLLEEGFCRQNSVIPLFKINGVLFPACANPLDTAFMDNLARILSLEIEPLFAPEEAITKALDCYYGPQDKAFSCAELIIKQPALEGLPFWRESERLGLNVPVSITIDDTSLVNPCCQPIESFSRDISRNGAALGLEILFYLPKGTKISIDFKPPQSPQPLKAKGEIIYCRMEKSKNYFLGIKFSQISSEALAQLLNLAESRK
mgnify:FL=1